MSSSPTIESHNASKPNTLAAVYEDKPVSNIETADVDMQTEKVSSSIAESKQPAANKNGDVDADEDETDEEDGNLGKSVLPIAKVKRILKVDNSYLPTTESSVFTVAKSTEFFIQHLAMQAYSNAKIEKRKRLQYKDFSSAVSNHENLFFLKKMVPPTVSVRKLAASDSIKYSKSRSQIKNTVKAKKSTVSKETKETVSKAGEKNKDGDSETPSGKNNSKTLPKGQQVLNFKKLKNEASNEADDAEVQKYLVDSEPDMSENEDQIEIDLDNNDEVNDDLRVVGEANTTAADTTENTATAATDNVTTDASTPVAVDKLDASEKETVKPNTPQLHTSKQDGENSMVEN